jgi:hypothetical protein
VGGGWAGAGTTYNLHYWIGKESSLDKAACAAIRATQLNSLLGSVCKHYREAQADESKIFRSYFGGQLEYTTEGSTDSAFRVVEKKDYAPRLYRVYDNKGTKLIELVECSPRSLNSREVFIVDTPAALHVWVGAQAHTHNKMWAQVPGALLSPVLDCQRPWSHAFGRDDGGGRSLHRC